MTFDRLVLRSDFAPQKGQDTGSAPAAGAGGAPGGPIPGGSGPGTGETTGGGTVQDGTNTGGGGQDQDCMGSMLMILPMVAIFYFLLIRPQQKQEKQRRELVSSLQTGDKVVMNSGLHGTIVQLTEQTVTIDAGSDTRLTFDRGSIARSGSPAAGGDAAKKTG